MTQASDLNRCSYTHIGPVLCKIQRIYGWKANCVASILPGRWTDEVTCAFCQMRIPDGFSPHKAPGIWTLASTHPGWQLSCSAHPQTDLVSPTGPTVYSHWHDQHPSRISTIPQSPPASASQFPNQSLHAPASLQGAPAAAGTVFARSSISRLSKKRDQSILKKTVPGGLWKLGEDLPLQACPMTFSNDDNLAYADYNSGKAGSCSILAL